MKRLSDAPLRLPAGHVSPTPFGQYVDKHRRRSIQESASSASPATHPQGATLDRATWPSKVDALSGSVADAAKGPTGATRHGRGEGEVGGVEPVSRDGSTARDARGMDHMSHDATAASSSSSMAHCEKVIDQTTPRKQLLLIVDALQKELQERTLSVNAIQRNFEKLSRRYADEHCALHDLQVQLRSAEEERSSVQKMLAVLRVELHAATQAEEAQRQAAEALRAEGRLWAVDRGMLVKATQAYSWALSNAAHAAQTTLESKVSLFASGALDCLDRLRSAALGQDADFGRERHCMYLAMYDLLAELHVLTCARDVTPRVAELASKPRLSVDDDPGICNRRSREDGAVDEAALRRRQKDVACGISALQAKLRAATEDAQSMASAHNAARLHDLVTAECLARRALVDAEAEMRELHGHLYAYMSASFIRRLCQVQSEKADVEAKAQAEVRLTREGAERECVDARERCAARVEELQEQLRLAHATCMRTEKEATALRARLAEHQAHFATQIARERASRCDVEAQLQSLVAQHAQREAGAGAKWRQESEAMHMSVEAAQRSVVVAAEAKERTVLILQGVRRECAALTLEQAQLRARLADDAATHRHKLACTSLLLEEVHARCGLEREVHEIERALCAQWVGLQSRQQYEVGRRQTQGRAEAVFALQCRESEGRRDVYEEVLAHSLPTIYADLLHSVVTDAAARITSLQSELTMLRRTLKELRVTAAETAPLWALQSADAMKTDCMTAALAAWRQQSELDEYEQAAATSLQRLIVVESSSESLYSCPLCLQLYSDPVTCVPCGHTYCGRCLQDHALNRNLRETVSTMALLRSPDTALDIAASHTSMLYCPECQMQNVREVVRSKTLEYLAEKYMYKRQVLQEMLTITCESRARSQA